LSAAGLAVAGMQALTQALNEASVRPDPGSLAVAVALVTLLPMAVVVPMSLVCLAVAAGLPPAPAAAVILAGVAANTSLAWILARTVVGERVEAMLKRRGGWLEQVRQGAVGAPLKWAFLARFAPAPFIAAPMVLSAAGVGLGTTLLGSLLGMAPWTAVYIYATRAGREDSLGGISRAAGALVLSYVALFVLRRRLLGPAAVPAALRPRAAGRPVVRLYTVRGQDLSDEARAELAALRDALGFEVDETPLEGDLAPELALYLDHAPVATLAGERLFNYKMDENVLRERLARPRQAAEKA